MWGRGRRGISAEGGGGGKSQNRPARVSRRRGSQGGRPGLHGKLLRTRGPGRVGRIFWIHIAAVYVFEGRQPGNAEAAAEGGDQVRSWHGFDFALVPLHAGALHPGTEEFRGGGMERAGGVGGGDENQFGDSGYG